MLTTFDARHWYPHGYRLAPLYFLNRRDMHRDMRGTSSALGRSSYCNFAVSAQHEPERLGSSSPEPAYVYARQCSRRGQPWRRCLQGEDRRPRSGLRLVSKHAQWYPCTRPAGTSQALGYHHRRADAKTGRYCSSPGEASRLQACSTRAIDLHVHALLFYDLG